MAALKALTDEKNMAMFNQYGVFTRKELESRYEVFLEEYHRRIRIEGEIALEIARSMIMPAAVGDLEKNMKTFQAASAAGIPFGTAALKSNIEALGRGVDELSEQCEALATALKGCHEEILAAMSNLRQTVDALEKVVADEVWPLPKYREMLFVY